MPQIFRSRSASTQRAIIRPKRVSPRQRGYSARWDRISKAYRRANPFCAWCEQIGRLRIVEVVDHKVPIVDGGEMFDPQNWWGLCVSHHGLKAEMEGYARQHGLIDRLKIWCDDPTSRPARFTSPIT